jgi:hypothetical protein
MRVRTALPKFIILLAILAGGGIAIAQDSIPETPPELRDFRLDPERSAPQPQTDSTTQPVVETPPPAVSPVRERATERPRPPTERRDAVPRTQVPAAQTSKAEPKPKVAAPVVTNKPRKIVAVGPLPAGKPQASWFAYWQIAAGLALAGIILASGIWFRGRRRVSEKRQRPPIASVVEPAPVKTLARIPPALAIPVAAPKTAAKMPSVKLEFLPENAKVSLATLTVKGRLRLTNTGDATAKHMELRAGLISAGEQQGHAISAFHAAGLDVEPEALGDAKPGEKVDMSIELSVPLTEMQSFSIGAQKLMVPIMVANLVYRGPGEAMADVTQIACMIGREASPPVAKMGALRLDLGPRSFAPLGQRPVIA